MQTITNEFIHLGEVFKKKRQEKSLSLKEVENAISIRLHYLAAIEEGHLGKLISPIYAQGFIKKYAIFLDLDGESLIKQYPQVVKLLSSPKDEEKEEFVFGLGTLEGRGVQKNEMGKIPNLVWAGLSVLIIVSLWFLARYIGIL